MSTKVEPIRPIKLNEIRAARERIANTVVRTPLIRLELGPEFPDIRLKLENLQPINAYKLRGAANAVAALSEADRQQGVWTISAGNAGQGVAYAARAAGVPCTVVVVETAPKSKLERMKAVVDDYLVVTLKQTKNAMRLLTEKARIISEGAGALSVAAALSGEAGKGPIVAIISGGNIDLQKFCELISQSDY